MKQYAKVTPEGSRDLLFEECDDRRRVENALTGLYEANGYRKVITPTLEFFDVFNSGDAGLDADEMYKLTDNRGRTTVLRPDNTLPIARLVATRLSEDAFPVRLYYNQSVFVRTKELAGRTDEVAQSGIELIGDGSMAADIQVITLACRAMQSTVPGFKIELGHAGYFGAVLRNLNVKPAVKAEICHLIEQKNFAALGDLLDTLEDCRETRVLRRLPRLFGGPEVLDEARELYTEGGADASLQYIKTLYDTLCAAGLQEQVLLPILASGENVIRITEKQVGPVLQGYRTMFETVRLVDPEICMQVSTTKESHSVQKNEDCFALWGKSRRCECCISQDAVRMGKIQTKVEPIGNDVYYVFAMPIEIDGMSYSLECVNPIRSEDINGIESEHVLNQLLVRNRQVYMDSATRVYNRRYYDERVRNLSGEYALAMIDIDNFKKINDRFGHTAGDAVLYYVAQTIRSMLRSNDALIRYGGDEFFLLFDNMPERILERKLEELCRAVHRIEVAQYPELKLTISIGGVYASGRISDLIQKADAALYEAKKEKNRAVIF